MPNVLTEAARWLPSKVSYVTVSAPRPKPANPPVPAVVPTVNRSWHHFPDPHQFYDPHRWDDKIRENTGVFDLSGETEVPLKNIAESEAEHAVAAAENARIGRRNCTLMIPELYA